MDCWNADSHYLENYTELMAFTSEVSLVIPASITAGLLRF